MIFHTPNVPGDEKIMRVICAKIRYSSIFFAYLGKSDIIDHMKSKRHQSGVNAGSTSKNVSDFFKKIEGSSAKLDVEAKDATFSYHTAKHNFSFKSNDCSSNLIRLLFEPKFTLPRTK